MVDPREIEFNLVDEPWIRVQSSDLSIKEVSLQEALISAHQFKDLAGESPTQNVAVLRVLLAVLHTVFERVDVNDATDPIKDIDSVLSRWEQLWKMKQFPPIPICRYLSSQHDKFWLFHPTNPFWQVPITSIPDKFKKETGYGTMYSAAKMNGEIDESNNKGRLFLSCTGDKKNRLTYSDAARWLININAFGDATSFKFLAGNSGHGLPSVGSGWLGKIGFICAKGNNLFETLMLNMILLRDASEIWDEARPIWERQTPKANERTEITIPNNPAELYTLQSRRMLLSRENDSITGCSVIGGDFFDKENAYPEQMTVWRPIYEKKDEIVGYQPRKHDISRQMWRDFSAIFTAGENQRKPGLVLWLEKLQSVGLIKGLNYIHFCIVSSDYDSKGSSTTDVFSDSLSIHSSLFTELGRSWQMYIVNEISVCDSIAWEISKLADNISLASGDNSGTTSKKAKELFYARVDIPFRRWLRSLDPESDGADMEADTATWRKTVLSIAFNFGKELADAAGTKAYVGREITKKENNKETTRHYSAPEAFNWFCYNMKKYQ